MEFENRREAGRELARRLAPLADRHPIVLGLPRGGVVVAREIADALGAPLDVLLVRKVGAPGRQELAIGAVGEGGVVVTNADILRRLRLSPRKVDEAVSRALTELDLRAAVLRRGRAPLPVSGKTVVLVDDGIATGASVRAALRVLRARGASRIVLAVPVAPADVLEELSHDTDHTICPNPRVWMRAVGNWYRDFSEVSERDVLALLDERADAPEQFSGRSGDR
ncbi:phosphoribosyltransferase [Prauserella cavernicola]|uniref:Phosphoribosyltransferase n=1 Tax=Prauserella cavernicola TaxID=2800127 RepID=A0A934V2T2_9PSEU|nr:phosphoribosyltransferase family protein [Prauserella cavernicola]MBK1782784.1 phosphoribosyltransferase [Prauserella cavernicola]